MIPRPVTLLNLRLYMNAKLFYTSGGIPPASGALVVTLKKPRYSGPT